MRERLTQKRLLITLVVLSAVLLVVACVAIAIGSESVSVLAIVKILAAKLTGQVAAVSPEQQIIIAEVRLPRVLLAIIVGAALSVAGTAYQALLRNPLADPYILGVSTGAALGAIAATVFAERLPIGRPVAAFIGATLTIATVYFLGQTQRGASNERLILAGVITNSFLSSAVIFLLTVATGSHLRSVFSWLIGDFSGDVKLLPLIAGFIVVGMVIIFFQARSLNLLMIGEEPARALGVEVRRVQIIVYLSASLITGAAVAVSGVIGFVGLIIPHAVRLVGGSDNRLVVPASAFVGAIFLLFADTIARTVIAPSELHIGVITALIGAPVFVYLLRRVS
ncbi:MAG: iron ABC transporter permease [Acidobacteria bacterium]|nr:iron ABC transporter permease [Acidobacteriota bacterium]